MVDEKTAAEFDGYMKRFPELYVSLASRVKAQAPSVRPVVLDLGAGTGLLSVEVLKQIPEATVYGVDPLRTMLSLAQKNIEQSNIHGFVPLLGVSENIPLKDSSVDVIMSRFSLPYWTAPSKSFSEMYRVLKPGGAVVFEALNQRFPAWKLWLIKLHMVCNRAGTDVTRYHVDAYKTAHTSEQVEQLFIDAGFSIVELQGKKTEWRFMVVAKKN